MLNSGLLYLFTFPLVFHNFTVMNPILEHPFLLGLTLKIPILILLLNHIPKLIPLLGILGLLLNLLNLLWYILGGISNVSLPIDIARGQLLLGLLAMLLHLFIQFLLVLVLLAHIIVAAYYGVVVVGPPVLVLGFVFEFIVDLVLLLFVVVLEDPCDNVELPSVLF